MFSFKLFYFKVFPLFQTSWLLCDSAVWFLGLPFLYNVLYPLGSSLEKLCGGDKMENIITVLYQSCCEGQMPQIPASEHACGSIAACALLSEDVSPCRPHQCTFK